MAKDDNSQRFLSRLSVMFEKEGDTQTARALRVRVDTRPLNGLGADGRIEVDSLRRRGHPDDEDAIRDIARLAQHLGQVGELARAERTYRNIVSIRNRQNHLGTKSAALRLALSDWSVSLARLGDQKSARATMALADRIH